MNFSNMIKFIFCFRFVYVMPMTQVHMIIAWTIFFLCCWFQHLLVWNTQICWLWSFSYPFWWNFSMSRLVKQLLSIEIFIDFMSILVLLLVASTMLLFAIQVFCWRLTFFNGLRLTIGGGLGIFINAYESLFDGLSSCMASFKESWNFPKCILGFFGNWCWRSVHYLCAWNQFCRWCTWLQLVHISPWWDENKNQ